MYLSVAMQNQADVSQPQVDNNIPIPTAHHSSKYNWPVRTMKIGESFTIPTIKGFWAARGQITWCSKATGRKFITRSQPGGGWRVWRTA